MQELESAVTLVDKLARLGAFAIFLLFFIGFWRGWWVFGTYFEGIAKEKEEWKKLYLSLIKNGDEDA